jgi:predicted nucleotidyltransferase component of viral defense system
MILQTEIRTIAEQQQVPANTIDKDYVLGHFLNALFSQSWAKENFVFKGGTCLKKCYFENYRFSEDIDITISNSEFELSKSQIEHVCELITASTGIQFNILRFDTALYNDIRVGWDVEICFWGANHSKSEIPRFGKDCHTKISFDIRTYEKILFPTVEKSIYHDFSDKDLIYAEVPCYSLSEVLAEKLRSLLQRKRGEARDYYDLWYIHTHAENLDWIAIKEAFYMKCAFKNIEFKGVEDFFAPARLKQVEITWNSRLSHQLREAIDKELVLKELKAFMEQLFE